MSDLQELFVTATTDGWAGGVGTLDTLRAQAKTLGWTEVATRRGDPVVAKITPTTTTTARPRSLSATYGTRRQPLHTDGAHLQHPPDIIVLACASTSTTPTLLWKHTRKNARAALPWTSARHGMFLISNGRDSFFGSAFDGDRYRYDPGCMTPCDTRAAQIAAYFTDEMANATPHSWSTVGQLLVIDNRTALHAREAVAAGDETRALTRAAFRIGASS